MSNLLKIDFSGKNLQHLPSLLHDKVIHVDISELCFENIDCLRLSPYLRKLNLKRTLIQSRIPCDKFSAVLSNLKHLKVLYLHYNEEAVDDQILRVIGRTCTTLRQWFFTLRLLCKAQCGKFSCWGNLSILCNFCQFWTIFGQFLDNFWTFQY